jgi:regulatory protein YycI of two-component signal transduction system YycFG
MFSIKQENVIKVSQGRNHFREEMSNDFPIRNYIVETYGYVPSFVYPEDTFSDEILAFLVKNSKYINSSLNGSIKDIKDDLLTGFKNGFFWFKYKNIYIKLSVKNENEDGDELFGSNSLHARAIVEAMGVNLTESTKDEKKVEKKSYSMMLCNPSNIQDNILKDFEPFVISSEHQTKVHLFIKNQYGEYTFEPIPVNLPKDLDLELNYGKDFLEIDKKVKKRLMEKSSGLFMFHGMPGTGKTTYIKYLADKVDRDFIYIPTTMIENFTSDPNCLHTLISKPNCVIILEDAEKAILKRQGDGMDSSAVSALLNLSDGILSDILKTSVVLTYNCPKQDVDDALKRKGRLQVEYEFGALSVEDAKKLAKKLKYPKKFIEEKITNPLTISDIYNLEKEVEFYAKNGKKEKSDRIIGFGK